MYLELIRRFKKFTIALEISEKSFMSKLTFYYFSESYEWKGLKAFVSKSGVNGILVLLEAQKNYEPMKDFQVVLKMPEWASFY